MEHGDFRHLPERWQLLNDPGTRAEHADADANRNAHFPILDTKGTLVCQWATFDAARNREVFDHYVEAEFEADWAATVATYGDQACPALMPRTAAQRAADAMTAIFQRAAAAAPSSKQPKSVGVVHVDWHTFSDWMIEAGLFPERHVDPFDDPTPLISKRRCETGDGILIDPDAALQVLLEGHVRFVIQNDQGIPIHWGREQRLFTGAARDAVMSLLARCTHPGCVVRAGRSQADHTSRVATRRRDSPRQRRAAVQAPQPIQVPRLHRAPRPPRTLAHVPTRRQRDPLIRVARRRARARLTW